MLPTAEDVEAALQTLTDTDETFGILYARKDAGKEKIKLLKARAFLNAKGSVAERNATADCDPDVIKAIDDWENHLAEFKIADNKRNQALTIIDVWRSINANQRRA